MVQVCCQRITSNRERLSHQLLKCMSMRCLRVHVFCGRLRPGLFSQWGFVLLAICFTLQISCVEYWAGRNHKSMVGVTPFGIGCLPTVLRGLEMISHGLRVFWRSILPSHLLRIVLLIIGVRLPHFLCFVEIRFWGAIPIHGQSLCLWLCLALLHWVLIGKIYGFPLVSLRLGLIFLFPLRLDRGGNETHAWLYW